MSLARVRIILKYINAIGPCLNDQELSDIARILDKACDRLIKETKEEVEANAVD